MSSFDKATKVVKVPPNFAPPDARLRNLLENVEKARRRLNRYKQSQDYEMYVRTRTEALNYSNSLKKKLDDEFVSKVNAGTTLSEVWRWVKAMKECKPRAPLQSLCLKKQINPETVLNEMLVKLTMCHELDAGLDDQEPILSSEINNELSDKMSAPFTMLELDAALKAANPNSAAGPDKISNKQLKSLDEGGKRILLQAMNNIIGNGEFPADGK